MRGGARRNRPPGLKNVVLGVWLSPGRFFRELDPGSTPLRSALFAALVLYLNLLFEELLQEIWLRQFNYGLLNAALPGLVVSLVLGPLLVAGLSALVLIVLDGALSRRKFGPVFKALGYATAVGIVFWIPYVPFFAIPYGLYVATVAVKEALSISWSRAAVGTLVPLGAVLLILLLLTGSEEAYRLLVNPPGE